MSETEKAVPKYVQVAELIKRRIAAGDYSYTALPGGPKLSRELGIGYLTVREAFRRLVEEGALVRRANDRLEAARPDKPERPRLKVGFVHPSHVMRGNKWFDAIRLGAERFGCEFHSMIYSHPDDSVLFQALDGDYRPLFYMLPSNELLINKLKNHADRIVTLFANYTESGIRRLDGVELGVIAYPIRYLHALGCRKIDYFSTTVSAPLREVKWREAIAALGCTGEAWLVPGNFAEPTFMTAYRFMSRMLDAGKMRDTEAFFCHNAECAMGCVRALRDYGIRVPEDVRLAAMGTPELARIATPSITTTVTPPLAPLVDAIFRQYLGLAPDDRRLDFYFRLQDIPLEQILIPGESTAPNLPGFVVPGSGPAERLPAADATPMPPFFCGQDE